MEDDGEDQILFEDNEPQQEQAEEVEPEFEVEEEEAQSADAQKTPMLPSQSEIDEHNITHLPFRNWCPFCIRGRGQSSGHFARKTADEQQIPMHHIRRLLFPGRLRNKKC